jgi:predicted alpha/beta superfamily hydrolase
MTLVAFCLASSVQAQQPPTPEPFLADVDSRVVTSAISGRDYQVSVALPFGYADSTKAYPVLYAVDANGQFGTVVEAARILNNFGTQIPQLLIVGIGYPSGGRQILIEQRRFFDLFPTEDREFEEWHEEWRAGEWPDLGPFDGSGGGADFLLFLREELIPQIESEYRVDPSDRAMYGHSAGGYFGLYALLEGEGTFNRVVAGSPALFWDDRYFFGLEETYSQSNRELPARVFLSVGLEEHDQQNPETDCFCMVRNLRRLIETLERRGYEGLEYQVHFFEGENHQSVVPATVSRGLRFIYGPADS